MIEQQTVLVNDIFIIKPLSTFNRNLKFPLDAVEIIQTVNEKGKLNEPIKKPFEGNGIYGSKQALSPSKFNLYQGYYEFDGEMLSGESRSEKEKSLQELVKSCGLVYIDKKGETKTITEVNLRDIRDPFMNHENFKIKLDEMENSYDLKEPINRLKLIFLRANDSYMYIEQDDMPELETIPHTVEFLIFRKDPEQELEVRTAGTLREIIIKVDKLDIKELKLLCGIWGILYNKDSSEEMLKNQIVFHLTEKKHFYNDDGDKISYISSFNNFLTLTNIEMQVKVIVKEAKRLGVIRATSAGFEFNGLPLGTSTEEIERELNRKENEFVLENIRLKVESLKSKNS